MRVAYDIQVQIEVEAVPSIKDQLQNVLDGLGMDDESATDDEVNDSY